MRRPRSSRDPLSALHRALRDCLDRVYFDLRKRRLVDHEVRLLDSGDGTAGKARLLVGWQDSTTSWSAAGVPDNVVEASWSALQVAVRLKLFRLRSGIGELSHD